MTTKRENMPYTALPGAVLVGVSVNRCARCGAYEVQIPSVDELNLTIANAVIRSRWRLSGVELRFLRRFLGYTGSALARLIGSTPATVSRWECGKQLIGHHADLLMRAMVAIHKGIVDYPISTFATIAGASPYLHRYAFKRTSTSWRFVEPFIQWKKDPSQ